MGSRTATGLGLGVAEANKMLSFLISFVPENPPTCNFLAKTASQEAKFAISWHFPQHFGKL